MYSTIFVPKYNICDIYNTVLYMLHLLFVCSMNDEDKIFRLFGDRLKELRKAKGFSNYEQFAYAYNFNRVQYGRYEKGCLISLKTLLKILSFHDITLNEFFDESFDIK